MDPSRDKMRDFTRTEMPRREGEIECPLIIERMGRVTINAVHMMMIEREITPRIIPTTGKEGKNPLMRPPQRDRNGGSEGEAVILNDRATRRGPVAVSIDIEADIKMRAIIAVGAIVPKVGILKVERVAAGVEMTAALKKRSEAIEAKLTAGPITEKVNLLLKVIAIQKQSLHSLPRGGG